MGGPQKTQKFARFFVAPGVAHCGGGSRATPTNALDAVVNWVENNRAPEELAAQGVDGSGAAMTRPACQHPAVAMYKGHGDPNDAHNFSCTAHQNQNNPNR